MHILNGKKITILFSYCIVFCVSDQIAKKRIVRSEEGIAMIKDMLFILKEICDITWEKSNTKCSQNNDSVEANDDNIENEAAVNNEATASSTGIKNASQTKGKVRDAMPTMNDAVNSRISSTQTFFVHEHFFLD